MARTAAAGTRERILDVATALFYARGVRAVGMSQIIGAAGCGKNLLYGHFPSKAELVTAYMEQFRTLREQVVEQALRAAGDDPADRLVALVEEVAARAAEPRFRGCPFRNYLTEFPDPDDAAGRLARRYLRESRAAVDELAGRLPVADPAGLAERVWLILDGLYAGTTRAMDERAGETAVALVRETLGRALAEAP